MRMQGERAEGDRGAEEYVVFRARSRKEESEEHNKSGERR